MNALRTWARRRGFGRFAYRFIHQPRAQLDLARTYGWTLAWRAWRGEGAMRRAAWKLAPLPDCGPASGASICLLTGRRFIQQTLFCAHSFARWVPQRPAYVFLSDGSLAANHAQILHRQFPGAAVSAHSAQDHAVATALPPGNFPVLHTLRLQYVLLRKLTDAMAGHRGYRLFFDSDMLFWREPTELLARAAAAEPLYLADTAVDGYTATRAAIAEKFGVAMAASVNSGLVGLAAERIDWELMERVCDFLLHAPGDRRLLEQTLWAVALGAQAARPLDAATYRVITDPFHWSAARRQEPSPALLHYAWHARLPYVAGEWRRWLREASA